jgi:hypothetical protein
MDIIIIMAISLLHTFITHIITIHMENTCLFIIHIMGIQMKYRFLLLKKIHINIIVPIIVHLVIQETVVLLQVLLLELYFLLLLL